MFKPGSPFTLGQEARTGIVTLDDDPCIILYMLDTTYCENYDYTVHMMHRFPDSPSAEAMTICDAELYTIADKYQDKIIRAQAARWFHETFEEELDPPIGPAEDSLSINAFINIIKTVFETTPDSDRTLRNLLVRQTERNLSILMASVRFQSELKKVDCFWSGFAYWVNFIRSHRRTCPQRGHTDMVVFPGTIEDGEMLMHSPATVCQTEFSLDEWKRPEADESESVDLETEEEEGSLRKRRRSSRDQDSIIEK
ncbi:hypothetical protein IWZ03DRAFT_424190 [Phyllosticta citriasiana]|uniref:Uncharacterized protein n=1 Tax=Phyllosticta citriasiana TaxID=595635 RepID=A0ABR1KIU5_9PEZI